MLGDTSRKSDQARIGTGTGAHSMFVRIETGLGANSTQVIRVARLTESRCRDPVPSCADSDKKAPEDQAAEGLHFRRCS